MEEQIVPYKDQKLHHIILTQHKHFNDLTKVQGRILEKFCLFSYIGHNLGLKIKYRYRSFFQKDAFLDEIQVQGFTFYAYTKYFPSSQNTNNIRIQEKQAENRPHYIVYIFDSDDFKEIKENINNQSVLQKYQEKVQNEVGRAKKQIVGEGFILDDKKIDMAKFEEEIRKRVNKNENDHKMVLAFEENLQKIEQSKKINKVKVEIYGDNIKEGQFSEIHIQINENYQNSEMSLFSLLGFKSIREQTHHDRWLEGLYYHKKSTRIQYYYLEPQNEKNKIFSEEESYVIALQGGGAKGIAYLGAWEALLQNFGPQKAKSIKSVIGSSIGAIIGLAITCDLKTDEIKEICAQYFSTLIDSDKITEQKLNIEPLDPQLRQLKEKIYNWEEQFTNWMEYLSQENYITINLQKISVDLKDIGEIVLSVVINKIFPEYYPLLVRDDRLDLDLLIKFSGAMTGNSMKEANIAMLEKFYRKYLKKIGIQEDNICASKLKAWIQEKLTFNKLYQLNEIQFTATSVDLNDNILRFFNHRTTPDLPVCHGVRMSGSFPVGFLPQIWNQQWGHYYIHYSKSIRELDLKGHTFTDGGVLSNYPIQYLDNEKMRPKYMCHPHEGQSTKRKIIGLQIQSNPSQIRRNTYLERQEEGLMTAIIKKLWQKRKDLSLFSKSWNILKSFTKNTLNIGSKRDPSDSKKPQTPPLISFILMVLKTFLYSKDNLAKEVFDHERKKIDPDKFRNKSDYDISNYKISDVVKTLQKIWDNKTPQNQKLLKLLGFLADLIDESTPQSHRIFSYDEQDKFTIINYLLEEISKHPTKATKQIQKILVQYKQKDIQKQLRIKGLELIIQQLQKRSQQFRHLKKKSQDKFRSLEVNIQINEENIAAFQSNRQSHLCEFITQPSMENMKIFRQLQRKQQFFQRGYEYYKKNAQYALEYCNQMKNDTKRKSLNDRSLRKCLEKVEYLIFPFLHTMKSDHYESIYFQRVKDKLLQLRKPVLFEGENIKESIEQVIIALQQFNNVISKVLQKKCCNENECKQRKCPFIDFKKIFIDLNFQQSEYTLGVLDHLEIYRESLKKNKDQKIASEVTEKLYLQSGDVYANGFESNKKLFDLYKKFPVEEIRNCNELFKHEQQAQAYLNSSIEYCRQGSSKIKTIHLVLESNPIAKNFMHKFIRRAKNHAKVKGTRVSSITGSGFNSFVMFLHASGLPAQKIQKYLNQFEKNLGINENYLQKYDKYDWIKLAYQQLQEFEETIGFWKNDSSQKIFKRKQVTAEEFEDSLAVFSNKVQQYLNFLIIQSERANIHLSTKDQDNAQKAKKLLSLGEYKQKNAQEAMEIKNFYQSLLKNFEFLIPMILGELPNILESSQYGVFKNKKSLWKAIILSEALNLQQLQKYIAKILKQDLFVNPDINLKDFYLLLPENERILLNFSTINLDTKMLDFLNYETKPYMPVHTAIIASMSVPFYSKPKFIDKMWNIKPEKDIRKRQLDFEFEKKLSDVSNLVSADFLTEFPLHLLTNNKISERLGIGKNQIFCGMSFRASLKETNQCEIYRKLVKKKSQQRKGFGVYDLVCLIKNHKFLKSSFLEAVPFFKYLNGFIQIYMESYDKLMIELYKDESIRLPVRISTLEFDAIFQRKQDGFEISQKGNDLIDQSYYTMKEKLQNEKKNCLKTQSESAEANVESLRNQKILMIRLQRFTPLFLKRSEEKYYKQRENSETEVNLRILSLDNKSKCLQEKNKVEIFWNGSYSTIKDQYKILEYRKERGDQQSQLRFKLRITFPDIIYSDKGTKKDEIIRQRIFVYEVDVLGVEGLQKQQKATFKINYSTLKQSKTEDTLKSEESENILLRVRYKNIKSSGIWSRNQKIHCLECLRDQFTYPQLIQRKIRCNYCLGQYQIYDQQGNNGQLKDNNDYLMEEQIYYYFVCSNNQCPNQMICCLYCIFESLIQNKKVKQCPLLHLNLEGSKCKVCEQKLFDYEHESVKKLTQIRKDDSFVEKCQIVAKYLDLL